MTDNTSFESHQESECHRVYVGEVPAWLLTEDSMKSHFSSYGTVLSAVAYRDPMAFDANGFGYLEFPTRDAADAAVAAINKACGNRNEDDTSTMFARTAFARGPPKLPEAAPTFQTKVTSQRFSQFDTENDEDEDFLLSFSQRASRPTATFML
ncbi:hypothetical protein ACHHYP_07114 [Achlya hypogyna]|uniref:RRM domain-containing protein n=1 Tax=Achlya hypogyna TaxID=1202772 RepID=A0A1V9ZMT3_ACHHY|nr:hypothetical protein ACHHYP_07114 [Achlya hypogyna]